MDIPNRLQQMQSEFPGLTQSSSYIRNLLPRDIPLSSIPGARLLKVLRDLDEFELLRTHAEVTFASASEDEWLPQYYLGGSGDVYVGVYVRRDIHGDILDEVAIKEILTCGDDDLWDEGQEDDENCLLREAVLQRQLNLSKSESKGP